jgi:phosphoglycolate phosphatase-like HAD superfamily hydrolase
MRAIKAVLFEPVGCLAEFPPEEFNEIAASVFDVKGTASTSGSEAYWQVLDLMQQSGKALAPSERQIVDNLEIQAAGKAHLYEDVAPALAELKAMNMTLVIASSLSTAAVSFFLDKFSLNDFFSAVWTRDNARGVKVAPLAKAMESAALQPEHVMCLADTADGLNVAKEASANAILMFNDYDEGKRLAMHRPTGAIVSLHELPDAIRFVAESAKVPRS